LYTRDQRLAVSRKVLLRFLEVQLGKSHPELSKRIYFQNTYFYETLTKGRVRSNNINYDAVKRWSNKVEIFSYDYIIVPVCEKFHWYVAIICNAPKLLSPSEEDDQEPHEADDALPEPSRSRYARLQNSRPHADLIGDLTVKDGFEEENTVA
jgi:Ulp1 family protease